MSTEIVDLSMSITDGMATWPGDVEARLWRHHTLAEGLPNTGGIQLGTHAGTHLDAPFHWFEDGDTIDKIPLGRLVGTGRVIDLRSHGDSGHIDEGSLASAYGKSRARERVLLLTGWAGNVVDEGYPTLSRGAAEWLVRQAPALVGIDTPSIDPPTAGDAHAVLLGAGIPILESLVGLDGLTGREFGLAALPVPVTGMDGAPVRAVAIVQGIRDVDGRDLDGKQADLPALRG